MRRSPAYCNRFTTATRSPGSLWSLAGDHRYALFFAAPTGHADHLKERLKGYKLSLAMCDGSATNNVIEAEDGCGAIRGGWG